MKFVEVDDFFVDILMVIAPAAFVEEKVYLFVNHQEDFCMKVFVPSNAAFVLNAVLFSFSMKWRSWLDKMLDSPKMYYLANM